MPQIKPLSNPMDDLPAAVAAFEEDVARIDIFVNGDATQDYLAEDGRSVPSLSKVIDNVNAMIAPDVAAITAGATTATNAAGAARTSELNAAASASAAASSSSSASAASVDALAAATNANDSAERAEAAEQSANTARDEAVSASASVEQNADRAATAATNASNSASAAATSAGNAKTSETNAAASAGASSTSAGNAAASASAASSSKDAAAASATSASASKDAAHQSELNAAASAASIDPASFVHADGSVAMTGPLVVPKVTFSGQGARITGDFSANTHTARVLFQTSTPNANTLVGAIPNGTATTSAFNALSSSDPDNSNMAQLASYQGEMRLTASALGTATYQAMTFYTGGLERIRIASNANRIQSDMSTQSPNLASRLYFQTTIANAGTTISAIPNGTGNGTALNMFGKADPENGSLAQLGMDSAGNFSISATKTGTGTYGPMLFNAGGVQKFVIDGATATLTLKGMTYLDTNAGNTALSYGLFFRSGSYQPHIRSANNYPGLEFVNGANTQVIMRLLEAGCLQLGVAPGNYNKAVVSGYGSAQGVGIICNAGSDNGPVAILFANAAVATVGSITTSASATAYNTTSDYRLKTNVEDLTGALERVVQCRPVSFDWIADGKSARGFIAHELQEIEPDAVTGEKDEMTRNVDDQVVPQYQGVDLSFVIPDLVGAIKELKTQVDELRAELAALIDPLRRAGE